MATPGVAFDLSVNLESSAFIGSILAADVREFGFPAMEFTTADNVVAVALTLEKNE